MYQRQFGLEQSPFGTAASGDQVFTGIKQDKAVANLKIGLSKTDAVVALVGPAGVGKSTLALRAVEASSQQALTAVVAHLALSGDDLLEILIAEFGINSEADTTMARFQDLRCFFAEQTQEDCRLFILVEDAAVLGADNLNLLNALTAADPRGYTGANLILMGDEGLLDLLATESLTRLQQRVRAQQSLEPFSAEETTAYIAHRIASAGGDPKEFLDDNVGLAVFQSTQGIARVIDNLMDTALCFAFSRKQGSLLPAMVQKVARSIYRLPTGAAMEPASSAAANENPAVEEITDEPQPVAEAEAESESEESPQPVVESSADELPLPEPAESIATQPSVEAVTESTTTEEVPAKSELSELAENTAVESHEVPTEQSPSVVEPAPLDTSENVGAIPVESLKDLADVETAVAAASVNEVAQATAATTFAAPQPELAEVAAPSTNDAIENTSASEPPQDEASSAAPQQAPAVDVPAANPIPVLEDAIELALMDEDASVIAEALAIEPVPIAESAELEPASPSEGTTTAPGDENPKTADGAFEDWAAGVAQAASLEELDAQIAETLFGSPDLESLSAEISSERQAAKPIEERSNESEGIVPNNVAGGGLG